MLPSLIIFFVGVCAYSVSVAVASSSMRLRGEGGTLSLLVAVPLTKK